MWCHYMWKTRSVAEARCISECQVDVKRHYRVLFFFLQLLFLSSSLHLTSFSVVSKQTIVCLFVSVCFRERPALGQKRESWRTAQPKFAPLRMRETRLEMKKGTNKGVDEHEFPLSCIFVSPFSQVLHFPADPGSNLPASLEAAVWFVMWDNFFLLLNIKA